ncbi:MAG: priA, partial [Chloroflexi bacterium]|nr:priA [Chloroflexota bacterium]MDB5060013.1 priA [Chloroflexota bacterium]
DLPGTVVVQTYVPGHFAIQAAANHDYAAFYQSEILYRQDGPYPPFSRLARLIYSDRSDESCSIEAHLLADKLHAWTASNPGLGIEVIGPAPCFVSKSHDRYYWQILLRSDDVHPILSEVPRGWSIDVDPVSLL